MAVLTDEQRTELRRLLANEMVPQRMNKTQVNAALQAVEDTWETAAVRNAFSNAIDAATTPIALTNAEKRILVKFWLKQRFDRGN